MVCLQGARFIGRLELPWMTVDDPGFGKEVDTNAPPTRFARFRNSTSAQQSAGIADSSMRALPVLFLTPSQYCDNRFDRSRQAN